MTRFTRFAVRPLAAAAALFVVSSTAYAGPPLLCHPYNIGSARSLPWSGASSWFEGDPAYNVQNVVADTEALLTPSTPVIVRMETLRRAAIYASADAALAGRLLDRFVARAEAVQGQPDALAWLDAAYLAGAYREMTMMGQDSHWGPRAAGLKTALGTRKDSVFIGHSLAARPDDPNIRFAAALIVSGSDRQAYQEHAARARAGASSDAMLARNLDHIGS
jgi:hypothetical protein